MLMLVICLPLLSALCAGFLGTILGNKGAFRLTTYTMFVNVGLCIYLFYRICIAREVYFCTLGSWINSNLFQIN